MVSEPLKQILIVVNKLGFLKKQNKFDRFAALLSALFATINFILVWMYLFYNKFTILNISIVITGAGSFAEVLSAIWTVFMYNDELLDILNKQKMFWEYTDQEIALKKKTVDQLFTIIVKIYYTLSITTILIQGSVMALGSTPLVCYVPGDTNKIWTIAIGCMQNFCIFHISFVVSYLDLSTAIIFTELSLQMEQLNKAFSNMKNLSDIRKCVQYNIFLKRYIKTFEKCMNVQIFVAYFSIMSIVSTQLILMADSKQSFEIKIKSFCFVMVMVAQFGMYCLPASNLRDACEKSSQAIADCDLVLNGSKSLKTCLIIMMKTSQRMLSIKIGGIFELNRTVYVNMLKSTYSFYTLMNQKTF